MKLTTSKLKQIIKEEYESIVAEAEIQNPFASDYIPSEKPEGQEFAEELMSLVKSIVKLGERHGKHIDDLESMVRKALDQASLGSKISLPQKENIHE